MTTEEQRIIVTRAKQMFPPGTVFNNKNILPPDSGNLTVNNPLEFRWSESEPGRLTIMTLSRGWYTIYRKMGWADIIFTLVQTPLFFTTN